MKERLPKDRRKRLSALIGKDLARKWLRILDNKGRASLRSQHGDRSKNAE